MAASTPETETPTGVAHPPPAAADVFISFGSDDLALARELRTHLEAGGYTCWMAPDDVSGPKTWAEQIVDAIAASKVVLVVISSTANQSTHVSKEVDLALEHAKAVLPVRIEDVVPSGALKYLLALAQWIDAFPGPLGPHADEVRRRVAAIIGTGTTPRRPEPTAPPMEPAAPPEPEAITPEPAPPQPVPREVAVPEAAPAPGRRRRWILLAAALGLIAVGAAAGVLLTRDGGGPSTTTIATTAPAAPAAYGDDPMLDRLLDRCGNGDLQACDTLLTQAPADSEYWRFAYTCGERTNGGGDCTVNVDLPSGYGDDPGLDRLWDACETGDPAGCDELARLAPLASPYWQFGDSCGGRRPRGGGSCVDLAPAGEPGPIGVVYDIGGRGDRSFNASAAAGLDRARAEIGLAAIEAETAPDGENRGELLNRVADEGAGLVFGVGFTFTEAVVASADAHPETRYVLIDGSIPNLNADCEGVGPLDDGQGNLVPCRSNIVSLGFAEHEGSFLVGAAAGLKSTTKEVGFIGGVDFDVIHKFQAGFAAGVAAVCPECTVTVAYVSQPPDFSGFADPDRAREIGLGVYRDGIDVVYHAAGGSGIGLFEAARQHSESTGVKVWAIGVDSDQYLTAPPEVREYILTSMVKRVDVAVFEAIRAFAAGELEGGYRSFGLAGGGVGYATSGGFVDDIAGRLEELMARVVAGEITVPDRP
jgi:basic membrane protein A